MDEFELKFLDIDKEQMEKELLSLGVVKIYDDTHLFLRLKQYLERKWKKYANNSTLSDEKRGMITEIYPETFRIIYK